MRAVEIFILTLALAATAAANEEGFAYDSYEPKPIADVFAITDTMCGEAGSKKYAYSARKMAYRVDVTWTGYIAPIDPKIRELLLNTEKTKTKLFARPMDELFKRQIKVTDGAADYWLPIQELLVAPLKVEIGPQKPVRLYVTYMACSTNGGKRTAVAINEFESAR